MRTVIEEFKLQIDILGDMFSRGALYKVLDEENNQLI